MATDKLDFQHILKERRDIIANRWYQAIEETSLGAMAARGARQQIDKLTDRLLNLLLADFFDPQDANSLGSSLANIRHLQSKSLGRTQEVLAEQVLSGLSHDQEKAIRSRLIQILAHLATGYTHQIQSTVLKEQEQIHQAFVIAINKVKKDLVIKDAAISSSINGICFCDFDGWITDVNPSFLRLWGYERAEEIIGENVVSLAQDSDYLSEELQSLQDDGGWVGEFVAQRKGGSPFHVLASASLVWVEQDQSTWLMFSFMDITERKRNQVRLEQRAVQLAFLDEIGQQIANLLDLDEVLKKVVNFVQRAFDYHQTSVFVIDQERDAAILKAQAGSLTDLPSDHSIPLGEGLVGWVGCHGRAKVVNGERAERWYANDDLDVSSIRSELAVPIQVHGETWGVLNIQSPCRDGLEEDDILVMNTVADRLSVAVENAQLYDTVKREQRALEQHIERLEILHSVDQAILGAKSVEDVAQVVLGRVWEVVPACWWGSLTLFDFDTGKLQLMAFRCDADVAIETGSRYSLASWKDFIPKLEQGEPIILEDIREVIGRSEDIQELYVEGLRSVITVPMGYQGELLGILTLGSNEVEGLGAEYLPVAKEIADSVATMIHQADLLDSLSLRQEQLRILMRRLSEAEEAQRRSLARILHNQIGQSLTALGLNLNVVKSQLDAETAVRVDERLDDSLNLVDEMADHIRSMIADLRPPMLEDYGLVAALDWYSKKVSSRVDMDITVASEREDVRLPEKIEMALFRIAQEALTNTLKHAQASQITITVTLDEDVVRLVIADDGIGFNVNERPAPDDEQSWGLLNMRERAEAVGGRCHIESYPGEGTRIIVEVRR